MGKLKECTWSANYQYTIGSDENPEPIEFYMEGLLNSNKLHLLLGYFSSSAISLLAPGFAYFISNGGELTMIINQFLSSKDKEAFERGLEGQIEKAFDLTDVSSLENTLNKYDAHFFQCLAFLIAEKKIKFQVIRPKIGNGISHYKQGIFYDGENKVGFSGSCNFTSYGFLHNRENLNVYLGWEEGYPKTWINTNERLFEKYVKQEDEKVEYLPLEKIEIAIKEKFGGNLDIQGLLSQEEDLIKEKLGLTTNPEIRKIFEKASKKIKEKMVNQSELESTTPKFPYQEGPRPYQVEAYQNWIANNYKGLFAMATGTGKTITSLNCILSEFKINGYYKFIVLVPTTALATQWKEEIEQNFNFKNAIICSSNNKSWKEDLKQIGKNIIFNRNINYALISTYSTFKGSKFQAILKDCFEKDFKKITLIADEAHTFGSPGFLKILPIFFEKRLGLSATPERQFDENGNSLLCSYFETSKEKYTYEFDMKEAIEKKFLSKYYYYPKIVTLEQDEQDDYSKISIELQNHIDPKTEKYKETEYVKKLLRDRKNVIHKAKRKINSLLQIVNEIKVENFRDAFIYVPEGLEVNYSEKDHQDQEIEDANHRLIKTYSEELYKNFKLRIAKFTGETKNREEIINKFKRNQFDALIAMKCLDEGIDIPQAKIAIFCSSTGNPRQYIQRRGRVLRNYNNKEHAIIYDLIVKPLIDHTNKRYEKIERNLFLSELRRLVNFAVLAENKDASLNTLEPICQDLGIDLYELANKELENYKKI